MLRAARRAWLAIACGLSAAQLASAQPNSSVVPEFGPIRSFFSPRPSLSASALLVQVESRARAIELGLVPITPSLATFRGSWPEAFGLRQVAGVHGVTWSPGRRLYMDDASEFVHLPEAQSSFGVDGSGVVVGVVDTGLDLFHPDFRRPDGTTRVSWLLAYDESPRGVHAGLEAEFNCESVEDPCAVYDAVDIDAALTTGGAVGQRRVPTDTFGHGSHVAGIAAGAGEKYPGMAPAAELVIVKGASGVSIADARILEGVRFIFDRAASAMRPAVVNLSLGSSFGAHDGTSPLEVALEELATGQGRIIVTAAGNDGGLYEPIGDEPFPVGAHTEVVVPPRSEVRLRLFEAGDGLSLIERAVFAWVALSPEDEVQVGLRANGREVIPALARGQVADVRAGEVGQEGDFIAYVGNGADTGLDVGLVGNQAVVAIVGTWPEETEFSISLTGSGTARAWVDGFSTYGLGYSVLFGRARIGGTIGIPASSPRMIAVGATVNRNEWIDFSGEENENPQGPVGTRAYFSGSGPNQLGQVKPELLAPGGNVIASMSAAADPRDPANGDSQFASMGVCADPDIECLVVDDEHGLSSGTSMAAPVVAGAVALLLQRQPELDQAAVRDLLQIGAAPVLEGQRAAFSGSGLLDVEALLRAQDALASPSERLPTEKSILALADVFLTPDPTWQLEGLLLLRDEEGLPASGFAATRVRVEVEGEADVVLGALDSAIQRFSISGRPGQAEGTVVLRAYFDDTLLAEQTIPIFVDAANARGGLELAGGTCSSGPVTTSAAVPSWIIVSCFTLLFLQRRRRWARSG